MKVFLFSSFLFCFQITFGQKFYENYDSISKKRLLISSFTSATVWFSSMLALNSVWYKEFGKVPLHSFDDSKNWMQMDKVGHFYASYHFSEIVSKSFRWSGLSQKKSAIIGASAAFAYQLNLEFLDGKSSAWGFSWSDVAANTLGSSLYLGQELTFKKQVFQLKFSYHESDLTQYRPNILGSNFQEKLLKDYNAQNYWLCFSPFAFSKNEKLPKWLNLAFGYSVHNKLVGDLDSYTTSDGNLTFQAKREFLLSLDINVKELPIKKKWLKMALSPFNSIKIPFPSLLVREGVIHGKIIY